MIKKLLTFISLILYSCAPPEYKVPSEFIPYINEFKEYANEYNKKIESNNLIITYVDFGNTNIIGQCVTGNGINKVNIKQSYWNEVGDGLKKQLIHHELGHCWLKRFNHITTLNDENMPISIMYPSDFDEIYFQAHYKEYINELFK